MAVEQHGAHAGLRVDGEEFVAGGDGVIGQPAGGDAAGAVARNAAVELLADADAVLKLVVEEPALTCGSEILAGIELARLFGEDLLDHPPSRIDGYSYVLTEAPKHQPNM